MTPLSQLLNLPVRYMSIMCTKAQMIACWILLFSIKSLSTEIRFMNHSFQMIPIHSAFEHACKVHELMSTCIYHLVSTVIVWYIARIPLGPGFRTVLTQQLLEQLSKDLFIRARKAVDYCCLQAGVEPVMITKQSNRQV